MGLGQRLGGPFPSPHPESLQPSRSARPSGEMLLFLTGVPPAGTLASPKYLPARLPCCPGLAWPLPVMCPLSVQPHPTHLPVCLSAHHPSDSPSSLFNCPFTHRSVCPSNNQANPPSSPRLSTCLSTHHSASVSVWLDGVGVVLPGGTGDCPSGQSSPGRLSLVSKVPLLCDHRMGTQEVSLASWRRGPGTALAGIGELMQESLAPSPGLGRSSG